VHTVPLEGVFVQIGLLPNTDWLQGTLALSRVARSRSTRAGQTSLPGVFAAGDVTTVPLQADRHRGG
jgi:alkyl hydroperoxide reductase subunit F